MESSDESQDDTTPEINALSNVAVDIVVFLLIIPIFVFDHLNRGHITSQNAKRSKHLMLGVLISNALYQLLWTISSALCMDCNISNAVVVDLRIVSWGINWLFLIHRAKVVQGMAPILSKIWFEKIFPCFATVFTLFGMVITAQTNMNYHFLCVPYADSERLHFCWNSNDEEYTSKEKMSTALGALSPNILLTTFFLVLFVVPLYKVYRVDLGVMNDNQLRQRLKLKRLLYWSVALTLINQITSAFHLLPVFHRSTFTVVLKKLDPPINVWSSWLMVTRHRQYLQRILSCRCEQQPHGLSRTQSVFTDIATGSRRNSQELHKAQSHSSTRMPVPLMVEEPVEMTTT